DRPLSFDRHHQFPRYHLSWDARRDLDYSPSYFGMTSRFLGTASLIANDPRELHRKQVIKAVAMPGGVKPPLPVVGREPRR
ncbi:MAG TPA: hypothetical protein VNS33_01580, partial [Bradyrhizobium sp.]|nr:hypothetical protein [Bradyrhizobium sp.]